LLLGPEKPHDTVPARADQLARDDEPVPAVGPRAAPDRDASRVGEAAERLLGHAPARALHELDGSARVRRLRGAHLLGRVESLEAPTRRAHPASATTQTAAARSREWVMERSIGPAPSRLDQASTRPERNTAGLGR